MISEPEFKTKLLSKLNAIQTGWRDGDLENTQNQKVDIINDNLKIAIEIKDDALYKMLIPESGRIVSQENDLSQKNRQFKDDLKSANKKFLNYPDYKTVVILRTEMADRPASTIDYTMNGPQVFTKVQGELVYVGRPSTFFSDHDNSINEVGGVVFWGSQRCFYRKNINPNVNEERIIEQVTLEDILDLPLVS